ncbi:MAG: hypothetical protein KIS94_01115 [Chitinophagales bacterium]|nr:hypothetical protein [Chitinophagales bacterium]
MKKIFTLLLVLIVVDGSSQSYTLAYFKGHVEVLNGTVWEPLKNISTVVSKSQTIKVGDKSEAIFTDAQKQTIYLSKPGTYPVVDFPKYITSKAKVSLSAYYMNYIAHQITHTETNPEKNYKEQLKNKGGVSRAHAGVCLLGPVNTTAVIDSEIAFLWKNVSSDNYTLLIYDDEEKTSVKISETVKDTFFMLNRFTHRLEHGKTYYWTITSPAIRPCETFSFTILSKDLERKAKADLRKLQASTEFTGAMKEAVIGKFFEEKGLYENARRCYLKASALEPESETFSLLLQQIAAKP